MYLWWEVAAVQIWKFALRNFSDHFWAFLLFGIKYSVSTVSHMCACTTIFQGNYASLNTCGSSAHYAGMRKTVHFQHKTRCACCCLFLKYATSICKMLPLTSYARRKFISISSIFSCWFSLLMMSRCPLLASHMTLASDHVNRTSLATIH